MESPSQTTNKILIPRERIEDGFRKSLNHVSSLCDAAEILYQTGNYSASIPLAILALEESYKVELLFQALVDDSGISKNAWENISGDSKAHKRKLTRAYTEPHANLREKVTEETYRKEQAINEKLGISSVPSQTLNEARTFNPDIVERLETYDYLKQNCFYLNWRGSWAAVDIELNPNEREAVARVTLFLVKSRLLNSVVWAKCPQVPDPNSPAFEAFKEDEDVKERTALLKEGDSPEFLKKIITNARVLDRYNALMKEERSNKKKRVQGVAKYEADT